MTVAEYLQLLDWTGGQIRRDGKLGTIPTEFFFGKCSDTVWIPEHAFSAT